MSCTQLPNLSTGLHFGSISEATNAGVSGAASEKYANGLRLTNAWVADDDVRHGSPRSPLHEGEANCRVSVMRFAPVPVCVVR